VSKILKLLLIAAFFNALTWIVLIPVWQYPDEQAHFAQVQDIAELRKVPINNVDTSYEIALSEKILGTQRDGFGNNKYTYHPEYKIDFSETKTGLFEESIINLPISSRTTLVKHESTFNPPIYYIMSSVVYKLFYTGNLFVRIFAIRVMSAAIFIGTIFLTYKIGKIIFYKYYGLSLVLSSLVAFKPMLVYSSSGILPDSLVNLLFTIMIYIGLKIVINGLRKEYIALFVAVTLIGIMTRQQFLLSVPMVLTALITRTILIKKEWKALIIFFSLTISVFIFFTLFGTKIPIISSFRIHELTSLKFGELFNLSYISYLTSSFSKFYRETFVWYWGVYKWLSLTMPLTFYRIIKVLLLLASIGIAVNIFDKLRRTKIELACLVFFVLCSLLYFWILITWDYFFYRNSGYSFGIQGRYFFPLVIAHLTILLMGLWQIFRVVLQKYAIFGVIFISILMMIFNDLSLYHVSGSYYDTSSLDNFVTQVSQYKPKLLKGLPILLIVVVNLTLQLCLVYYLGKYVLKKANKNYN